ncbi:MAG: adenylate/guanylate cyclase domain-containing protein [Nitrospinales bacterium]
MAKNGLKRKLAAILSADVEGYSRLMGNDEASTIHTLTAYKEAMTAHIKQNHGRVVDAPGDNLLAEFASVVEAVQCAVEIQRELSKRNEELPEERKMVFRIGINLGDIVEEKDRIYGDGVNIAARLEGICNGGGVCISGTAFEHVEKKLDLEYEDLGHYEVKNIEKPIRVYRVLSYPGATAHRVELASVEKMAFPLPEKPSIAVLAFDNMSGDPEQDYLADGISENIITALSYIPEMFVTARNSSFTYKGKPVKVQQISEELGVRYVLEGSVLKSEDKVRITAQLIDALTGGHMWSERYDRDLKDLFSLLDEIAMAVTVALQVELTDGEQVRFGTGSTLNFEAWGYLVKGKSIFNKFGKEDMVRARELCEKALKIDPKYANALLLLAWTHKIDAHLGYTESNEKSLKLSVELAKKSVEMNDKDPNVHSLLSLLSLIQGDHEKAVEEGRKAIALGPSEAESHLLFGEVLYQSGNFQEAVKMCEIAIRLHPYTPLYYLGHTLNAYYWVGRYDESLALAKRLIDLGRNVEYTWGVVWGLFGSAIAKIKLGRLSEAIQDADEILKIWPWFNLDYFRSFSHYKDSAHAEQRIDELRMAGIPEHPLSQ